MPANGVCVCVRCSTYHARFHLVYALALLAGPWDVWVFMFVHSLHLCVSSERGVLFWRKCKILLVLISVSPVQLFPETNAVNTETIAEECGCFFSSVLHTLCAVEMFYIHIAEICEKRVSDQFGQFIYARVCRYHSINKYAYHVVHTPLQHNDIKAAFHQRPINRRKA